MGVCAGSQKYDFNQKLSPSEIKIITETWKLMVKSGLSKHGTNLMVKIFIEHKELKPLWRFARNLDTEDQMSSNQTLKAHGEKLFNAIDMAFFYILSNQMKNGIRQQIENENQKLVSKQNIDIQIIDGEVTAGNYLSNGNTNKIFPDCGNVDMA
ncbi:putative globin-like [Brachionus plicatilis]|uniref:Putative globin-like n=1 Tax=Brachionus plicatilis TaxID=10195 RepID=A0A3M7R8V1_BRAPC|nr:putative globin-like [Brachionus plicatilis]